MYCEVGMVRILKNHVVEKCSDEKSIENVVGTCRVRITQLVYHLKMHLGSFDGVS